MTWPHKGQRSSSRTWLCNAPVESSRHGWPRKCNTLNWNERTECRICETSWGAIQINNTRRGSKQRNGGSSAAEPQSQPTSSTKTMIKELEGKGFMVANPTSNRGKKAILNEAKQLADHSDQKDAMAAAEIKTEPNAQPPRTTFCDPIHSSPTTTTSNDDAMGADQVHDTALPHTWTVDLAPHFQAIIRPTAQPKEALSPQDHFASLLPKNSAKASATKAQEAELATILEELKNEKLHPLAKKALEAGKKELEEALASKGPAKADDTGPLRERTELVKIQQDIELKMAERAARIAKHAVAAQARTQSFTAVIEGYRTQLKQLEDKFHREEAEASAEWASFNERIDQNNTALAEFVAEKLTARPPAGTPINTNIAQTAVATAGGSTTTAAAVGATVDSALVSAQGGDLAAIRVLEQFTHRVCIEPNSLLDVETLQPDQRGLEALAGLWAWTEAMALEDERMIYAFSHIGVATEVIKELVGPIVWDAIFGGADVTQDTALPAQLRQLIAFQLRKISAKLQSNELEEVRTKATSAAAAKKKVIAKHTDKLRKAAGKRLATLKPEDL